MTDDDYVGFPAPAEGDRQDALDWFEDCVIAAREGKGPLANVQPFHVLETLLLIVRDGVLKGQGRHGRRRASFDRRIAIKLAAFFGLDCKAEMQKQGETATDALPLAAAQACEYLRETHGIELAASTMEKKMVQLATFVKDIKDMDSDA